MSTSCKRLIESSTPGQDACQPPSPCFALSKPETQTVLSRKKRHRSLLPAALERVLVQGEKKGNRAQTLEPSTIRVGLDSTLSPVGSNTGVLLILIWVSVLYLPACSSTKPQLKGDHTEVVTNKALPRSFDSNQAGGIRLGHPIPHPVFKSHDADYGTYWENGYFEFEGLRPRGHGVLAHVVNPEKRSIAMGSMPKGGARL